MGFFSKKKESAKSLHPEFLLLVQKWENFLAKIETRFKESLINAEDALLENLIESDYDINPTLRAWQGIKAQLYGLTEKIDTTYNESVEPQMLKYIERWEVIDQGKKGTFLRESLLKKIERFEIILEGKISKRFYNHAIQFLNKDFKCTQCSAKLTIKKDIFRSHYVSCEYCNTTNTFIPNDKISQIKWVADNIAKHNAILERDAMVMARQAFNQLRSWVKGEDITKHKEAFKNREETERAFWKKYFIERYTILPEHKDTLEHDIDIKMKWFYQERKNVLDF